MAFTAQEVENMGNALIDYHWKTPKVRAQTIQDKPLLKKMNGKKQSFPGGKDNIDVRVKGEYTTTIQGFSHDDTVSYANPANIKKAFYDYKLIHAGISFTMDEMIRAGITIADTTTGENTSTKSKAEKVQLAKLLNDKIDDMREGWDRGFNLMFWRDGTQDASLVPGIKSFVVDDPTAATVIGGIDQSTVTWWRNRADLSITLGAGPETGAVLNTLQYELRQLRRYGGRPDTMLAGSDMMERLEQEFKAHGYYTDSGWANKGRLDGSVTDIAFKNISIEYDPTLDDEGEAKRIYVLDSKRIYPMVVDGEDEKDHTPARPENKYVFFRAKTSALGLVCDQRNCHGVYGFA